MLCVSQVEDLLLFENKYVGFRGNTRITSGSVACLKRTSCLLQTYDQSRVIVRFNTVQLSLSLPVKHLVVRQPSAFPLPSLSH